MALINCPECGKQVSDTAMNCINCGFALHMYLDKQKAQQNWQNEARKLLKPDRAVFMLQGFSANHDDPAIAYYMHKPPVPKKGLFRTKMFKEPIQLWNAAKLQDPSRRYSKSIDVRLRAHYSEKVCYAELSQPERVILSACMFHKFLKTTVEAQLECVVYPGHIYKIDLVDSQGKFYSCHRDSGFPNMILTQLE